MRWGTCVPILGFLGLLVLQLFAMYSTDMQTERRSPKLNAPPLQDGGGGGNKKKVSCIHELRSATDGLNVSCLLAIWLKHYLKKVRRQAKSFRISRTVKPKPELPWRKFYAIRVVYFILFIVTCVTCVEATRNALYKSTAITTTTTTYHERDCGQVTKNNIKRIRDHTPLISFLCFEKS